MRVNIALKGDEAAVRILVKHPMETGLRKDKASGKVIPAHFIKHVVIKHKGQQVVDAKCGVAVSKDPFFFFKIKGVASGDDFNISWTDNEGKSESKDEKIG